MKFHQQLKSSRDSHSSELAILWVTTALAYLVLARFCMSLGTVGGVASPFWLPAGLVIALPILFGYRVLPGIFAGQFLTSILFQHSPWWVGAMQGLGNVLEGWAFLFVALRYMRGLNFFNSPRNLTIALPAALFGSFLNALCGVSSLVLAGFIPSDAFLSVLLTWSTGDLGGMLIISPLIFAWKMQGFSWRGASRIEYMVLMLFTALASYLAFFDVLPLPVQPLVYLLLPLLLYGAFRFAFFGAVIQNLLMMVLAILGTTHGHGPFAESNPILSIILLQAFTSILIATSLIVMVINNERLDYLARARSLMEELESKVAERTHTLALANQELLVTQMTLRENEAKLRGLYEMSPLGIALTDMNGRYIEFNSAFEKICGYPPDELKQIDYWTLTPREYERQESEQLELLRTTGRYGPYEKEYVRKDGSRVPLQLNGMIVQGTDGETYIWSIVEDITVRHQIDLMKNEFVSTVSHELRTPLTSIFGSLGLIRSGMLGAITDQMHPVLEIAYSNCERLTKLINDLLDMEKIMAGKMRFEMQPHPLMQLVEQAVESCRHYGEALQVEFEISGRADDAQIQVDGMRFSQLLSNFLSNAAKYSPQGGRVEIDVRRHDGRVRVEVRDHGPGIPADFRQRIFQKFSQADSSTSRAKGGTGLGLSIARELAERMEGEVGYDSVEGQGSTFYVEFSVLYPTRTISN